MKWIVVGCKKMPSLTDHRRIGILVGCTDAAGSAGADTAVVAADASQALGSPLAAVVHLEEAFALASASASAAAVAQSQAVGIEDIAAAAVIAAHHRHSLHPNLNL